MPNLCYLMFIGNPKHIIEATEKERRYYALTPSEEKIQDDKYFGELKRAWDDHERDALTYYLLNEYNLESFNMYKVPKTAGLLRQKFASIDNRDIDGKINKWLSIFLMDAFLPYVNEKDNEDNGDCRVAKNRLFYVFKKHCGVRDDDISIEEFGRMLKSFLPDLHKAGESVVKQGKTFASENVGKNGAEIVAKYGSRIHDRENAHIFPSVSVARQSFEKGMGGEDRMERVIRLSGKKL